MVETATARKPPLDPRTAASVAVAWVIFANKPFYPIYVWWLVGSGVASSLWTMLAAPFFLAVALMGRRWPLAARCGLPLVGTLDTLCETKLFGSGSGTELFLAPCIMLAAMSFHASEKWVQRGLIVLVFAAFALTHGRLGTALHVFDDKALATLLNLNAFAVASLMAFIALRFPAPPSA
jgi:hypothetical protein